MDIKLLLGSAFGCPDLRFILFTFFFGGEERGVECDEIVESSANFIYN